MLSLEQSYQENFEKICTHCNDEENETTRDMRRLISRINYGDLYVLGKFWIDVLKCVLVGAKLTLIPVVEAAKPEDVPKRPPPMKYKDLPVYASPHTEYKDYIEEQGKCPERKIKLVHRFLFPHVKCVRKEACKNICDARCQIKKTCKDLCCSIDKSKNDVLKIMRDPANLNIRRAIVASGMATGYLIGRSGGVPRKIFCTSLGGLFTGAMCFPKETDEIFRTTMYHTGKVIISFYNIACKKRYIYKERIPCRTDVPPCPPPNPQAAGK